jgi:hypothetical protein
MERNSLIMARAARYRNQKGGVASTNPTIATMTSFAGVIETCYQQFGIPESPSTLLALARLFLDLFGIDTSHASTYSSDVVET